MEVVIYIKSHCENKNLVVLYKRNEETKSRQYLDTMHVNAMLYLMGEDVAQEVNKDGYVTVKCNFELVKNTQKGAP